MNEAEKADLVDNLVTHLSGARRDIQERQVAIFTRCDPDYGARVAQGLGLQAPKL
jgi:catalase